MLLDVVPHLLFRPRNKWIDLDELVHLVPLYHLHVLPCHTLLSAQSAYPGIKAPESTGQRLQETDIRESPARFPFAHGLAADMELLRQFFLRHLSVFTMPADRLAGYVPVHGDHLLMTAV